MEEDSDIWQLFAKQLFDGKTTIIRIHKDATVDELFKKISAKNNIPPESQGIVYTTKLLEYGQGKYLSDYHMHVKYTLFVVLLFGGSQTYASHLGDHFMNDTKGHNTGDNIRGNSTGENNTGENNTGGNNTGDNNTGENNTGGNNTEVNNTGGNITEGNNNTGGNNTEDNNTSPPQNQKTLDEDVETTEAPDMISWEDDPNTPRAKMSCGHAITPETLTTYCESLLSAGKYVFKCPYISPTRVYCGKEWSYLEVRRLAVLTTDEKKQFETKISDNYLRKGMGTQECPKCHSMCERVNKKDKRVVCPLCSARGTMEYHFCWHCLHEWVGSGIDKCGNDDCSGEDKRLKILRDCKKKTIVGVVGCPSIRACLACGMLIEHDRACKHMVCTCGQKFCFICLKPAVDGRYQCGTYNSPCKITEVQTAIPGDN